MSQCATSLLCRALADFNARAMPVKCVRAFDEREVFVLCVCCVYTFVSVISHENDGKIKAGLTS